MAAPSVLLLHEHPFFSQERSAAHRETLPSALRPLQIPHVPNHSPVATRVGTGPGSPSGSLRLESTNASNPGLARRKGLVQPAVQGPTAPQARRGILRSARADR